MLIAAIIAFFIFALILIVVTTPSTVIYEEEEITETSVIKGTLIVNIDTDGREYVFDPVDDLKWFVDPTDTMYEDKHGEIWRLV